jgi:hypothetical protein
VPSRVTSLSVRGQIHPLFDAYSKTDTFPILFFVFPTAFLFLFQNAGPDSLVEYGHVP